MAFLFGAFLTVSHLPILTDEFRQTAMPILVVLVGVIAAFGLPRIGLAPVVTLVALGLLVVSIFAIHNLSHPPLTEYAELKRTLFWFIMLSCFVVFPLGIFAFDPSLNYTIKILVVISVIFALLAFVAPTGENIRRSGIELNPLMHAKLLFFPFFLLVAGFPKSRNRLFVLAAIFLGVIACLKTGSRSPFAVAIIILCLDSLLTKKSKSGIWVAAVLGLIVGSVTLFLDFLPPEIAGRFSLDGFASVSEEGGRLFLFELASNLIALNPGGIGMGNMSAYFWLSAPHNILLEVILDFGFLVSLPYIALVLTAAVFAFKALRNGDPSRRFLAIWCLFFLGHSLVGGEITFPSILLYTPMGLLFLDRLTAKRRIRKERLAAGSI